MFNTKLVLNFGSEFIFNFYIFLSMKNIDFLGGHNWQHRLNLVILNSSFSCALKIEVSGSLM